MPRAFSHELLPAALGGCEAHPCLEKGRWRHREVQPPARGHWLKQGPYGHRFLAITPWHPQAGFSRPGRAPAPPPASLLCQRAAEERDGDLARPLVLPVGSARGRDGLWPASVSSSVKWGCVIAGPFWLWSLLWFRGEGRGGETGGGRSKGLNRRTHSRYSLSPRALSGRLRLGLAEQSVLAALAQAVSLTPPGQGEPQWLAPCCLSS